MEFTLQCCEAFSVVMYMIFGTLVLFSLPKWWMNRVDKQQIQLMADRAQEDILSDRTCSGDDNSSFDDQYEPMEEYLTANNGEGEFGHVHKQGTLIAQ